jgi:hypothetical protein
MLSAPGWGGQMDLGQESQAGVAAERVAAAAGIVLVTLASAQFLMTLDSVLRQVNYHVAQVGPR